MNAGRATLKRPYISVSIIILSILSLLIAISTGDKIAVEYLLSTILSILIADCVLTGNPNVAIVSSIVALVTFSIHVLPINLYASMFLLTLSLISIRVRAKTLRILGDRAILIGIISGSYIVVLWLIQRAMIFVYIVLALVLSIQLFDFPLVQGFRGYLSVLNLASHTLAERLRISTILNYIRDMWLRCNLVTRKYVSRSGSCLVDCIMKLIKSIHELGPVDIDKRFLDSFLAMLSKIKGVEDKASLVFQRVARAMDEIQYDVERASFYILMMMNILIIVSLVLYALYLSK